MARRKPLEIEVISTAKGNGFKDSERDATRWAKKLGDAGKEAGDKMSTGLKAGVDKAGNALESAGSTAADMFSGGFDVSSIGDTLSGGLSSLGGVLGPVGAGLGVAAGAAFATGFMGAMETEAATDRLAAQLGGSEWAHEMGDVAGELYVQGFGESVADTGAAVKNVVQNGLLPEDATNAQIENLSAKLMTFTDVLEQDVDMTTQAVSNMMRTGIAESSEEALNVLTRGVQQGADRAGDLAETFQEYSTMFRDAGLSAADATGLMVQGLRAGARDADTVADGLKEFAIRAQDGSEMSAEGFKLIGLNAEKMTSMVAQGGPAAREALDKVLDGLRGMEDPVKRNAAAVALFGTKAEDMGDALFNLDLDTAVNDLGNVEGATDKLGEAYDNNAAKLETFKRQGLQRLTDFVGGTVIPGLEQLGPVFERMRAWVDEVVATVQQKWPQIQAAVQPVIDNIVIIVNEAVAIVTTLWRNFGDNILRYVMEVWPRVQQIIQGAFTIIAGIFQFFSALIQGDWQRVWDALGKIVSGAWSMIQGFVGAGIGVVRLILGAGLEALRALWNSAWEGILGFLRGLGGRITRIASGMWDGLKTGLAAVANWIIGRIEGIINALIRAYNAIPEWMDPRSGDMALVNLPRVGGSGGGSRPSGQHSAGGVVRMAEGGIVRRRPGGIIANIGEGPHDEAVIPLDGRSLGGPSITVNVNVSGAVLTRGSDLGRLIATELTKELQIDPRAVMIRGMPLGVAG